MKLKRFITTVLLLLLCSIAYSQEVNKETAEEVAFNFYYQQVNLFEKGINYNDIIIKSTELYSIEELPAIFAVNFLNGGYVLVSAQKSVNPIIGYNTNTKDEFSLINASPEFEFFFNEYLKEIEFSVANNIIPTKSIVNEWGKYSKTANPENLINNKENIEVGPLLSSIWNQYSPYNFYAPSALKNGVPTEGGRRCTAGCVAAAMSVIMQYWEWPIKGIGSNSYYTSSCQVNLSANFGETYYDYSSMPNILSYHNGEKAVHEVAQLMHHAGVAVEMMYCMGGCENGQSFDPSSGAYSYDAYSALKNNFNFPNAEYEDKEYNNSSWENMLIDQFNNGYPVYYSGCGNIGCHAWNCDGYRKIDNKNYFHHNFNWSGTSNGWYAENVSENHQFPYSQSVIKNLYPPTENYPNYVNGHQVLTNKYGRINDGSGPTKNYLPNTNASWLISPQQEFDSVSYIELNWIQFELGENDIIKIYDGDDENAPLVGTYSGTNTPDKFTSNSNKIYITFSSTESNPGFCFEYLSYFPEYCENLIETSQVSGEIISNPENKYYLPNTYCRWLIEPEDTSKDIKVHFNYLNTYDKNDYVSIYDIENDKELIFYGNEPPTEDLTFSGRGVLISFITNNNINIGNGFSLSYNQQTGIDNFDFEGLTIYPNPAKDIITVNLDNYFNKLTLELIDVTGKILYKNNYLQNNDLFTDQINVSTYKSGIYFIRLTTEKGTKTKKIILQK
ncbi:MAG: C10 family peptidase [Bacteroidales bacterium]